jgi:hypothetical protein
VHGRSLVGLGTKHSRLMSSRCETLPGSSPVRSLTPASTYGDLLTSLHTAKALLIAQIDSAKGEGASTTILKRELRDNRTAWRHYLSYLEGSA